MFPRHFARQLSKYAFVLVVAASIGSAYAQSTINLMSGWNLLGNSSAAPIDVAATFGDAARITSVWKWNVAKTRWALYLPSMTPSALADYTLSKDYEVLTEIASKEGYWVNAATSVALSTPVANGVTLGADDLHSGWNLVSGANRVSPSRLHDSLGGCLSESGRVIVTAWTWDAANAKWKFYAPSLEAQGGAILTDFIANKGYEPFTAAVSTSEGFWLNVGLTAASSGACVPAVFDFSSTDCIDKDVIGIVSFRGEGLAFSPRIDGFATMSAPLASGPHSLEELRTIAQDFFKSHPYTYGGFVPNFHLSAEGAGLALFDWSPNDFGGTALVDKAGASIVFAGQVVWSGGGSILYPGSWSASNGIVYSDAVALAPAPAGFVSLSDWNRPIIYDPASGSRALTLAETTTFSDASFAMLRKTDLLHGFAACGSYSVASYVYTPAVGLTSAKLARQLYVVRGRTTQHWQPLN